MNALILVLRLLHIVSGVFWAGAVITTVFFIEPTAKALDREGERFLAHLAIRRRLAVVLVIAATTAIGAGALMYWIDSGGLRLQWIESHTGIGFTAGALAALSAFAIVPIFFRSELYRLNSLASGRTLRPALPALEPDPGQPSHLRRRRHGHRPLPALNQGNLSGRMARRREAVDLGPTRYARIGAAPGRQEALRP